MADIINLNKVKKQRKKAEKQAHAAANRQKFGQSKGQKSKNRSDREALSKKLDGLHIYRSEDDGGKS